MTLNQTTGELPTIQSAYRLNGKNHRKWSQVVRTFLKGKGKLSHLLGTRPKKGDPKFDSWDEEDSMGDRPVTEYAYLLKNLWQEMDYYRCIELRCNDNAAALKNFIEKDRIYDFLTGLNVEFDQMRVQVLGKEDLPSLNETISIINVEKSRRRVMLYSQPDERSAMLGKFNDQNLKFNTKKTSAYNIANLEIGRIESRSSNKDNLWCNYCKKPGHTKEQCWKLHGKPQSSQWNKGPRRGTQRSQANMTQSREDKSHDSSGKLYSLYALSASSSDFSNSWVIDSRATDHMTYSSHKFLTYYPCPSNRQVSIADGSLATVAGQGDIILSLSITLKNDQGTKMMIGHAKVRQGVILRPGFIHGTRRVGQMKLPLSVIGAPLEMIPKHAKLLSKIPLIGPLFIPPVHVTSVAKVAVTAAIDPTFPPGIIDVYGILQHGHQKSA
ncbi:hypothetical protein Pint_18863 [Pistacia integerrima]|uniref:Uncharacterized protein n=1 Tax=Pistacia integerrima TaxID=434235 RepID=A0ACC0YW45_9ROSI|nr:hypothetical protein Pint_18863 [Pistacia integerrima]